MFDDLELTVSTVNRVRNNLPSLKERFNEWLNSHYKTKEVELLGNRTHNLLVAYEAKRFHSHSRLNLEPISTFCVARLIFWLVHSLLATA